MKNYVFKNYNDLSRLQYFSIRDGRLTLDNKAEIGPIIDIHTHLALAYLLPMQINLFKFHDRTEHMLPDTAQIDLMKYAPF